MVADPDFEGGLVLRIQFKRFDELASEEGSLPADQRQVRLAIRQAVLTAGQELLAAIDLLEPSAAALLKEHLSGVRTDPLEFHRLLGELAGVREALGRTTRARHTRTHHETESTP